jgi:CheY-like chemotaxis protein
MPTSVTRASLALDFTFISFLIVDDHAYSRRLTRSMLTGFGSREVYESGNGIEAFELARTVMPGMIITDLMMPIFSGLRFIEMVKEPQSPVHHIPVVVLSGYLTKPATLAVKGSGADELLVKPVSPKALYQHITRIMLRHQRADQPSASASNQKRRADPQRKKSGDVAYV